MGTGKKKRASGSAAWLPLAVSARELRAPFPVGGPLPLVR